MLRRIQSVRFGWGTTIVVIVVAVAIWAIVVLAGVRDFVPEELRTPREAPAADSTPGR